MLKTTEWSATSFAAQSYNIVTCMEDSMILSLTRKGLKTPEIFSRKAAEGPSRIPMLENVCFYFGNYADEQDSLGDEPSAATIFLKKIAVTNWMQLADYFNISAYNLKENFSRNESFNIFRAETIET
jgi:hypothetical protein